jgi:hypothetical protein
MLMVGRRLLLWLVLRQIQALITVLETERIAVH